MTNIISLDKERFKRRGILIDDQARLRMDIFHRLIDDGPNIAIIHQYGKPNND